MAGEALPEDDFLGDLGMEAGRDEQPWDEEDGLEGLAEPVEVPSRPTAINLSDRTFWDTRHLPVGSVLTFSKPGSQDDPTAPYSAVLVEARTYYSHGVKVVVKYLGASTKEERKAVERTVKTHGIHLCCLREAGRCPNVADPALHVTQFMWYPPGDFDEPFLSRQAKAVVAAGKAMAAAASIEPVKAPAGEALRGPPGRSAVEQRLGA